MRFLRSIVRGVKLLAALPARLINRSWRINVPTKYGKVNPRSSFWPYGPGNFTGFMLALGVLALGVLALGTAGCNVNSSPADGVKIGQITKVSKQGLIYKTWEAELVRGGLVDGSGAVGGAPLHFTIENDSLAAVALVAMLNQTEVLVAYQDEGLWAASRSDSQGRFAKSITPTATARTDTLPALSADGGAD